MGEGGGGQGGGVGGQGLHLVPPVVYTPLILLTNITDGGPVACVPAIRSARPGFESWPGAFPQVVRWAAEGSGNTVQIKC